MVADHNDIERRFRSLTPFLDERMRRLVAAAESEAIGYGGVSRVSRASGVSRRAISAGGDRRWRSAEIGDGGDRGDR